MAHAIGIRLGSILLLTSLTPFAAAAQSNRGGIGQASKAAIRISVSVMPRLNIAAAGEKTALGGRMLTDGRVFSNASGMRYTLVDASTRETASLSHHRVDEGPTVVLVVPD